jgi:hypothetical protein
LPGGDRILFIKGAANAAAYRPPYQREFDDIDVIVEDYDRLWPMLEVVGEHYRFDRLKVYQHLEGNVGTVDLRTNRHPSRLLPVDVHVGGYHIWGASRLNVNLWQRASVSNGRLAPGLEDCILVTCAHVATDWYYKMRDLNDIRVLTRTERPIDWDYLERTARLEGLDDILAVLISEAERVYHETLAPPLPLRRLSPTARLFARRNFGKADRLGAIAQQTRFTFPRYRRALGPERAALESARNGFNLVRYRNRAYRADDRRRIRRIRPNEILVLVPIDRRNANQSRPGRSIGGNRFRVVNEGAANEHFVTPYGIFVQAPYSGRLGNGERSLLSLTITTTDG